MRFKTELKSTLSVGSASLEILGQLLEMYGNQEFSQSLRDLAFQLQSNYETLRYHLSKLEKYGFLTIDKDSTHKCIYHLNVERIKQLLDD